MQLEIRAFELEGLLDRLPADIEVLSLDCFDTIIWRTTHAPMDVFADLKLPGSSLGGRILAEGSARRLVHAKTGAAEIRLHDVYDFFYPDADDETLDRAVTHELEQEARHAFAFTPALELIREAKRRGLKVIVVSDMYLSEEQVRAHFAAAAGEEMLAMVDHLFVSSSYGTGKRDHLFKHVLGKIGVAPGRIAHVGDNFEADYRAPARYGMHSVFLRQFDEESGQRLRMEAAAAAVLDPSARTSRAICQAHRAQIALRQPCDAATTLGHDVIGPVMHSFALWLKEELDAASQKAGRPVKPLFVMRDAYLPFLVFDRMFPDAGAAKVELSRFVSLRAGIKDAQTLDTYIAEWSSRLPVEMMARQLMLQPHEYQKALKGKSAKDVDASFIRFIRSHDAQRKIVERCSAFTEKLMAHLAAAGVMPGDAIMLIDVGYNGTVQNILTPVLSERLGLDICGRYLFLRESQLSGLDKRGMIDMRHYDFNALHALSSCVVVIEQLCNVAQGSTIDFTDRGEPVRETVDAKAAHSATRDAVQTACLTFADEAGNGINRAPGADTVDGRCQAAAAALARLFFLPNAIEVTLFEHFHFDMNMGTAASGQLIERSSSDRALRRLGISFGARRDQSCFLGAELQQQGLPTGLGMFAAARFGLDLRLIDYRSGGIEIPVIIMNETGHMVANMSAWRTVEGYYRVEIALATPGTGAGIQLGQLFEWVQIEAVEAMRVSDLQKSTDEARPVTPQSIPDGMTAMADDIYSVEPGGMLFVPPTGIDEPVVLSLVFRPLRWRGKSVPLSIAA